MFSGAYMVINQLIKFINKAAHLNFLKYILGEK
jgi:hypothetical protein